MEDAILREILIDDLIIFSVCCAGRAYTISRDELISRACRLCATLDPSLSPAGDATGQCSTLSCRIVSIFCAKIVSCQINAMKDNLQVLILFAAILRQI